MLKNVRKNHIEQQFAHDQLGKAKNGVKMVVSDSDSVDPAQNSLLNRTESVVKNLCASFIATFASRSSK
ncbi:hypothetical protein L596_028877 [Steinernema carpocapsae]|uniref:Uncharacterized protein n=1 Tax=Steinernema carpocapsae TaxID=34508 RepID=A0A4U5LZS6_STECR|nr:hypothetical protein L596_028877 [Steinernema carpocapsae]